MDTADVLPLLFLVCLLLFSCLLFLVSLVCSRRPASYPPGPSPLPIIGNIHQLFRNNPHIVLAKLSRTYGPLMHLKLGFMDAVVVSSPELAKQVLQTYDHVLSGRPNPAVSLNPEGSIVMMPANAKWRALRRLCKDHIFSSQKLDDSHSLRRVKMQNLINHVQQCCDNGQDLFIGGAHTTATAVEWMMAELIHNPVVMLELRDELQNIAGDNALLEESDISSLLYFNAVIKETFRLHPVIPFMLPHKAEADVQIHGYTVPKNATVLVNLWAIGRDSRIWMDADSFRPERFLDMKMDMRGMDFELIPFGSGRRMCPGMPLALHMVPYIVATLVKDFDWKVDEKGIIIQPQDMNMEEKMAISLHKDIPLKAFPIKI